MRRDNVKIEEFKLDNGRPKFLYYLAFEKMDRTDSQPRQIATSLSRLLPRLSERFANRVEPEAWQEYVKRIKTHFPRLFQLLYQLYSDRYDFFYHLENILAIATKMWLDRSDDLKALDVMRQADPHWYQSHRMVGAMCYVDLFAGDLQGLRDRIPYLKELGITYLHLGCAWVNYIRCHDDIGWGISNEDMQDLAIDPDKHRRFLTEFYTDRYENSFAKGLTFQEKPNGEARIVGTTASLCGLGKIEDNNDSAKLDLAIKRILLLHGIILTIGGIPLIYLGDELGTLNDYTYVDSPEKAGDSRWVHRSAFNWQLAEQRKDSNSIPGRIYLGLLKLIQIRQHNRAFSRAKTEFIDTGSDKPDGMASQRIFGYFRHHQGQNVLVLANFSDRQETIAGKQLRWLGMRKILTDLVSGKTVSAVKELTLEPYQLMILL